MTTMTPEQIAILEERARLYQLAQQEIAERKRVEAELRTSATYYRALIDSQVDLISRYLPDTTMTFVNDAYCAFYGKTREELIGNSYLAAPGVDQPAWKRPEVLGQARASAD
jgi:PAS domain-containing protein